MGEQGLLQPADRQASWALYLPHQPLAAIFLECTTSERLEQPCPYQCVHDQSILLSGCLNDLVRLLLTLHKPVSYISGHMRHDSRSVLM